MARTPVFDPPVAGYVPLLGRLSRSVLALLCVGGLAGGCTAGPYPAAPPTGRSSAAPWPEPPAGAPTDLPTGSLPTEAPPVTVLAVAVGGTTGTTTTPSPVAGSTLGHPGGHRARPRGPVPTAPAAAPHRHRSGPPTLCDLGEQYGKWAADGTDAAACRSVYG